MRIVSVGHAFFAATLVALGIMDLVKGDFTPVWAPVPESVPGREILIYLCAVVSLASGIGLLWRRTAAIAARVLLVFLLLWLLLLRVPNVFPAPTVLASWYGCAETAVMVAGAWVLYSSFATDWDRQRLGFAAGDTGLRIARVLYGLAMIFFGMGHFAYIEQTAVLIPGWLPGHVFWAYFTGGTFLLAGVGVLLGVFARLAAALSALQMGMFIVLVWLPIAATGKISAFQLGEFVVTCVLTAAAWVVADSYRGTPWLRWKALVPRRQSTPPESS